MKFFVNFLSAFRITAAFLLIPTMLLSIASNHTVFWIWASFILFLLGSISEWFDGYLARKYNVCTKIGGVMDHIGDKLLVVHTMIMLTVQYAFGSAVTSIVSQTLTTPILWLMVIPVVIMIARELYISGLREFLGTQKIEMPVPKARFSMGKIKTTMQMISLSLFLFMPALSSIMTSAQPHIINTLFMIAFATLWLALFASLWSATQYTKTFLGHLKKIK